MSASLSISAWLQSVLIDLLSYPGLYFNDGAT